MQAVDFDQILDLITTADPRFHKNAYHFIREALDFTQKKIVKAKKGEIKHVSGQQLLDGIREYALEQFGPMTLTVLEEWGLKKGEDFGEIVFNMVDAGLLAKTDQDTREDFKNGYDFFDAFRKPFIPPSKQSSSRKETAENHN